MPATSPKQRAFMFAEMRRKQAGQKTQTGMTAEQLGDFAHTTNAQMAAEPKAAKVRRGAPGKRR